MPPQFQQFQNPTSPVIKPNESPQPNKKKRGLKFIVLGLVLLVVAIGLSLWSAKIKSQKSGPNTLNFTAQTQDEFADYKTYRNEQYGFEFKYPPQYEVYIDIPNTILVIQPKDKNIKNEPVNNLKIQVIDNPKKVEIREWWNNYGPYTSEAIKKMGFGPTTFPIVDKIVDGVKGIYIGGREGVLTNYLVLPYGDKIIEIQNMIPESQVLSTFKFISTSTLIINSDTENIAKFEGFYLKKENYWYDEGTPYLCDAFVVTNGEKYIIDYFKDMVLEGNSINNIDSNGNLVIQIELNELDIGVKNKIVNSNKTNPLNLTLKKKVQVGKGAPQCYSFFTILESN